MTFLAGCPSPQTPVDKPCPAVEYPVAIVQAPPLPQSDIAAPRTLDLRLAPSRDDAGVVVALEVSMRFSVPPVDFGEANPMLLRLESPSVSADRIDDLVARDSEGSLALRRIEPEAGKPMRPEWQSERRARGPVTITYRFELPPKDASSDEIAVNAAGMMAVGRAIFLLPITTEAHMIRVRWDLQGLGEGARGSSTFGMDSAEIEGPVAALGDAIWAAGSLEEMAIRTPAKGSFSPTRFRLTSLGTDSIDVLEVGPWANRLWQLARTVSTEAPHSHFDLFVRSTGKTGSRFDVSVFGTNAIAAVDERRAFGWPEKLSLARAFVRSARGTVLTGMRWFDEGFVTYQAIEVLRRSGFVLPNDIVGELSKRSERYFASPFLRTPMKQLEKETDPAAALHLEDRGMLYAAELDARVRNKSAAKRSIDDLLRMKKPKDGEDPGPVVPPASAFLQALESELGTEALPRLDDVVVQGTKTVELDDGTFGPCFKKAPKQFQRQLPGDKKREAVAGFTWSMVPKPANCGATPQVAVQPKKP